MFAIPHSLSDLTPFQREEVRAEYRFLRSMGVTRHVAKHLIFRLVNTLTRWVD